MSYEIEATDPETMTKFMTNPLRDVAYFLPQLVPDLEVRLSEEFLPHPDKERLTAAGLDHVALQRTFVAFSLFFKHTLDTDLRSPLAAITKCGFLDEPQVCQDILLATFAKSLLSACWQGLRSSILQGQDPPLISVIRKRAEELHEQLSGRKPPAEPG